MPWYVVKNVAGKQPTCQAAYIWHTENWRWKCCGDLVQLFTLNLRLFEAIS